MPPPKAPKRRTERLLLLYVTIIVVFGFVLVYAGKVSSTRQIAAGDININQATAHQFAGVLSVDYATASQVVAERSALPGGQFRNVSTLRFLPALKGKAITWLPNRLFVRTASESFRGFTRGAILFLLVFWLLHFFFCRMKVGPDQWLVPMVMLLAGLGLMMVYTTKDPYRDIFTYVNQLRGIVLFGTIALLAPFSGVYRRLPLHRYGFVYAVGALALMLILIVLGHGPASVKIEVFGFQPIEFMKLLLVFYVASHLAERRISLGSSTNRSFIADLPDIVPLAVLYFIVLLLFLAIKDLGPAVMLFGTFAAMLYLATGRRTYPAIATVLLVIAGFIGYAAHIGFFATRVLMWIHPWSSNDGKTGQLAMGLWGLATGGVSGTGLGLGLPSAVPRAGSDMVFTSIGEELGLFGALVVLLAVCVIVWRGFVIARHAIDEFDRFLAAGLTFLLGLQAFVITAGTTGLLPLTGITLPFVSYGSSSLVADFFSIGVLLNLSRKRLPENVKAAVPSFYPAAARLTVTVVVVALLFGVGLARLAWIQAVNTDQLATRALSIPDADGVIRLHQNPRLAAMGSVIPRGRILDSTGEILAANPTNDAVGVSYLCGRPRIYPYGEIGANLVLAAEQPTSATNPIGCDAILRGYSSPVELLEFYRAKDLPGQHGHSGQDARLTIRIDLQRAAQHALAAEAKRHGTGRGAAVAIDVATGALLAAATYPSFDPNTLDDAAWTALHNGSNPANPLLDRPFAGIYTPGSAFKLITATASLNADEQKFTADCDHTLRNVYWRVGANHYSRARITDEAGFPPHGRVDLAKGLAVSCNVYFAQLGIKLGPETLDNTMAAYDLAYRPSLASIGENLPDCAYGQGADRMTPYEMARIAQTIGNNGILLPKRYVSAVPVGAGVQVLSSDSAETLRAMMRGVVTGGTARGVFDGLPVTVGGKTGSAQVNDGPTHSWFVGVAPAETPSIAFACIVEHGGAGRAAAAPVCRAIVAEAVRNPASAR